MTDTTQRSVWLIAAFRYDERRNENRRRQVHDANQPDHLFSPARDQSKRHANISTIDISS